MSAMTVQTRLIYTAALSSASQNTAPLLAGLVWLIGLAVS